MYDTYHRLELEIEDFEGLNLLISVYGTFLKPEAATGFNGGFVADDIKVEQAFGFAKELDRMSRPDWCQCLDDIVSNNIDWDYIETLCAEELLLND